MCTFPSPKKTPDRHPCEDKTLIPLLQSSFVSSSLLHVVCGFVSVMSSVYLWRDERLVSLVALVRLSSELALPVKELVWPNSVWKVVDLLVLV